MDGGPPSGLSALVVRAVEAIPSAVLITDAAGHIVWCNAAFTSLFGWDLDEIAGLTPRILRSNRHDLAVYEDLQRTLGEGRAWRAELINRRKDGRLVPVGVTIAPLSGFGAATHYVEILDDLTARRMAEQRVVHLERMDPLTGLLNRGAFIQAVRESPDPWLILIDLHAFGKLNELFGHSAGDAVLGLTAERIAAAAAGSLPVARVGGDEFAVLAGSADAADVAALVRRILQSFDAPIEVEGRSFAVGASVGIARGTVDCDPVDLLHQAEAAASRAVEMGSAFEFFDPEREHGVRRGVAIELALRAALAAGSGGLSLAFQPQMRLGDGRLAGAEVLVRWRDADLGQVSPGEFIPIAERTGLIIPLGEWIIEETFRTVGGWLGLGMSVPKVAVNVSAVQLEQTGLADLIIALAGRWKVPLSLIEVELTETAVAGKGDAVKENLRRLKEAGAKIAIDDFGTGYSSLSYLRDFPADYLKADISFVRGIGLSTRDEQIVAAVIGLAKGLGIEVVAEGIETPGQAAYLRDIGCDIGQGYLWSKPLAGPDFERYVAAEGGSGAVGDDGGRV